MESKEVKIKDKKFVIKELLAYESDEILDMNLEKTSAKIRERLKKQASLSDEDYNQLTEKDRDVLLQAMNEINGWGKFQETTNLNLQNEEKS